MPRVTRSGKSAAPTVVENGASITSIENGLVIFSGLKPDQIPVAGKEISASIENPAPDVEIAAPDEPSAAEKSIAANETPAPNVETSAPDAPLAAKKPIATIETPAKGSPAAPGEPLAAKTSTAANETSVSNEEVPVPDEHLAAKERSDSPLSSPPSSTEGTPPVSSVTPAGEYVSPSAEWPEGWNPFDDPFQRHLSDRTCPVCWLSFDDIFIGDFRDHVEICIDKSANPDDLPRVISPSPPRAQTEGIDTEAAMTDEERATLDGLSPYTSGTLTPNENAETVETIVAAKFLPITDPQKFVQALANPEKLSTATLYAYAEATQQAMVKWQDEWLSLDKELLKTGVNVEKRKSRNPRKVFEPAVYEDMREADIYNYQHDPHPEMVGNQDPKKQRIGRTGTGRLVNGRELRLKQKDKDEELREMEVRGIRAHRPRQNIMDDELLESRHNTADKTESPAPALAAKTRGKKRARDDDTPDQPEAPPKKRGRPPRANLLERATTINKEDSSKPAANTTAATETRSPSADELAATTTVENTPAPVAPTPKRRGRPPKNARKVEAQAAAKFDAKPAAGASKKGKVAAAGASYGTTPALKKETPLPSDNKPTASATSTTAAPAAASGSAPTVKGRVKSEKRSVAMTQWWAERRAAGTHRKAKPSTTAATAAELDANHAIIAPSIVSTSKTTAAPSASATATTSKPRGRPAKRKAVADDEAEDEAAAPIAAAAPRAIKRLRLTPPKNPTDESEAEGGKKKQRLRLTPPKKPSAEDEGEQQQQQQVVEEEKSKSKVKGRGKDKGKRKRGPGKGHRGVETKRDEEDSEEKVVQRPTRAVKSRKKVIVEETETEAEAEEEEEEL